MLLIGYCWEEGWDLVIEFINFIIWKFKKIVVVYDIIVVVGVFFEIDNSFYIGVYILMLNGKIKVYIK